MHKVGGGVKDESTMETMGSRGTWKCECPLRKAAGNIQNEPRRESIWASSSKMIIVDLSKCFRPYISPLPAPGTGHGASGMNDCCAGL